MTAALLSPEAAFAELREAVASDTRTRGVERGVVILAPDGEPLAWAGRHRFVPARDTAELRAVITPFYVSLEARRQTPGGGSAVGSVLLDAAPAAPDRGHAVSARFEAAHGIALRFYAPGRAPREGDVFDFCPTTCESGAALLSVQPVPPTQSDAKLAALAAATGRAGVALALVLLLVFTSAPAGRWRWLVTVAAAWTVARALQDSARWAGLFSPASFYRPLLGGFSASAGALTALGVVLVLTAAALWRRGVARRWWSLAGAGVLVLAAPYLVRYLGRGIAPPAGGVGFVLWMSWEAGVATAAMALVLAAAALVRGTAEPRRLPWLLPAACAWAGLAALAGLWLWNPYGAWPEWYTFVWLPALVGVLVPAPRPWAVLGIATVAGTAAALVTWGAAVEGRLLLAERDALGLGAAADPRAASLLERLGATPPATQPRTAGELYAWWLASPLAADSYPASLAVWHRLGEPAAEIRLASVDLPPSLLAALARSPETARGPRVERLERSPGVHYVLLAPEPRAHGTVASTATAHLRGAAHQLSRPSGGRARRVFRGPAARARALELCAAAGRRPPGRRSPHRTDAARRGGNGGHPRLRARPRARPLHAGARQPARRGSLALPRRRARGHHGHGARRARRGRSVSRTRRVRAPGPARRAGAHRRQPGGGSHDPRGLPGRGVRVAAGAGGAGGSPAARRRARAPAAGGPRAGADPRDAGGARRRRLVCRGRRPRARPARRRAAGGGRRRGAGGAVAGPPARRAPRGRAGDVGIRAHGDGREAQPDRAGRSAQPDGAGARQRRNRCHRGRRGITRHDGEPARRRAARHHRRAGRPAAAGGAGRMVARVDCGGRVPALPQGAYRRARVRRGSSADPHAARVPRAGPGRLRGRTGRCHGPHPRGARAGVGRDGPPGRPRDQESPHADPPGYSAPAAGA